MVSDETQFHETFSRDDKVRLGSDRVFGLVFAVVFLIVGFWPLHDLVPVRPWSIIISGCFLALALIMPKLLRPLNLLWFRFGLLLHKIVNPLVMGLLFYFTITPMALIFRMIGKDPLSRDFDPDAGSYWVKRDPPGPAPESMKNQF
jgi:hypothetical protein